MSQRRLHSVIESLANVAVGYTVNVAANFLIFPLFGWALNWRQNVQMGVLYTVISIVRSYLLRRAFNRWHTAPAPKARIYQCADCAFPSFDRADFRLIHGVWVCSMCRPR